MTHKTLIQNFKRLFAAFSYVNNSRDPEAIAVVVNVAPSKIQRWMQTDEWLELVAYFNGNPRGKEGDLGLAERLWTEMIQKCEHINVVDYPDIPMRSPLTEGDPSVFPLIHSHLFCVDNLCDDEIRERLTEEHQFEGEPVRYEGQTLENPYYFWVYPNFSEGIYSKVFARANVVGDLVIGNGEDTSLVCIRHGRFTLTRKFADDVVNIYDERLLVCL